MSSLRESYASGSVTDGVLDDLAVRSGIHLPSRPSGVVPSLPEDITELGDEDLMVMFSDFVAWADYAAAQLAVSSIEERESERQHALSKARAIATVESSSVSEAKAKAEEMSEDESFANIRRHAYRKILQAVEGNLERDANLISRELSRRLGDKGSMVSRKSRFTT